MNVYKAGRNNSAGGVNDLGSVLHTAEVAYSNDPIAANSHVSTPAGGAGAIDDSSVLNDNIVHVSILQGSLARLRLCPLPDAQMFGTCSGQKYPL
jgi:hypothetical protein